MKRRKRIKVLLVDDEQAFVDTLAMRLELRDLIVDKVYDGEQALAYIKKDVPDVMVLDLEMPGLKGMDVLRSVRKSHPHLQVIILTGYGTAKDAEEARRIGSFGFLMKPVEIDTLVSRILDAYYDTLERMKGYTPPAENTPLGAAVKTTPSNTAYFK